jgi:hypothetical protein
MTGLAPRAMGSMPPATRSASLPRPRQLAALGAVLCLSRAQSGSELAGWAQAVRAEVSSDGDSDGLRESLVFLDRDGRCCWRLYLLPDSDFLAWEQLAADLPLRPLGTSAGAAELLWLRLANRLRGERWHASALRLHALPGGPGFSHDGDAALAASLAVLSTQGLLAARRIARAEGADGDTLDDDCCCRRAALAARAGAVVPADDLYPLIRLKPGGHQ